MKTPIIAIAVAALIGIAVFVVSRSGVEEATSPAPTETATTTDEKTNPSPETSGTAEPTFTGVKIAGNYYEYTATDYQAARTARRPIFLFFYANWCPTCAQQEPIVKQLMSEIVDESKLDDIVAFRVNYNDNATSKDEEQLANDFGVRYQHTMFALGEDGKTVKKFLGQTDAAALRAAFTASVE